MKSIRVLMIILSVIAILLGLFLTSIFVPKLISGNLEYPIMAITPLIPALLFIADGSIGIGVSIKKIKIKDIWFWIILLAAIVSMPLARAINLSISR